MTVIGKKSTVATTFLSLLLVVISPVTCQWQSTAELYKEDRDTGLRTYYSPEFYAEIRPLNPLDAASNSVYYREYYYDERYSTKDYYWKSYDQDRNIY